MTININNQEQIVSENSSIASLLEQLHLSKKGIAVAINNEIITRDKWNHTVVCGNDNITVIQATQGG